MGKELLNKPLVEALVEVKWQLLELGPGALQDPVFPLFIGRFADQLKPQYPIVEPLPAVQVPNELTPYIVKYRFRKTAGGYPLIQAGPGVASINFDKQYQWPDFCEAAHKFYDRLIAAYATQPKFNSCLLRYINSMPIDPNAESILEFVRKKLHINLSLPEQITGSEVISGLPQGMMLAVPYRLKNPQGIGLLRVASGETEGKPALVWEINVQSLADDTPQKRDDFVNWLAAAHDVVDHWFFTLIDGDLEKLFGEKTPCKQ